MDKFFKQSYCDRCGNDLGGVRKMSRFNTDCLCTSCETLERQHPKYREAQESEAKAVIAGVKNYPGIGLPDDLRKPCILIEKDYKGSFSRFALTEEEFSMEYPQVWDDMGGYFNTEYNNTYTLRPLVHIYYEKSTIGSERWKEFFTNMEWGLCESDIETDNLAYVCSSQCKSLTSIVKQFEEVSK